MARNIIFLSAAFPSMLDRLISYIVSNDGKNVNQYIL